MVNSSNPQVNRPQIPETGFLRIWQIVGNPKANPPIPPIIPVCRSTFLNWVKRGKAPNAIKLSERTIAWRAEDIRAFIDKLGVVDGNNSSK